MKTNRFAKISSFVCFGLAIFLYSISLSEAEASGYRFKIRMSSTSDWATIEASNTDLPICFDHQILDNSADSVMVNCIYIYKLPYDSAFVSAEFFLFSEDIPPEGLELLSEKGDIGCVQIDVYNWNLDQPDSVVSFSNEANVPGDPRNPQYLTIPKDLLIQDGPLTLPGDTIVTEKTIFAFYYPWYGNPDGPTGYWRHWVPENNYASPHTPILGYYDSLDDSVIAQHIRWSQSCGVDAFICSWWGISTLEDLALPNILEIAQSFGIQVSIYLEASSGVQAAPQEEKPDTFINELNYIFTNYGNHPAFYKFQGAPVIFIYGLPFSLISLTDWENVLSAVQHEAIYVVDSFDPAALAVFQGCHIYSPVAYPEDWLRESYKMAAFRSKYTGKIFAATVAPGYNDTLIRDPGFFVPRDAGTYYQSLWDIALSTEPDWIIVTTWNEWHEGTEIEPSLEYGEQYLDLTMANKQNWCTDVNEEIAEESEKVVFALSQNYPNPFNPRTLIRYDLPKSCNVTLTIYNILGQKVRTLLDEHQKAGAKVACWDSKNDHGATVASGIYFYRIKTENFVRAKKMVIIK